MFGRMWAVAVLTVAGGAGMTSSVQAVEVRIGLPSEVANFVERSEMCNAWLMGDLEGEDDEIAEELKSLECGRLDSDETRLRRKYRSNNKILKAIDDATDLGC